MAAINTPKGLSEKHSFDTVYEKLEKYPEIREKIIQKIKKLASNLQKFKNTDPKSIYEEFFHAEYKNTPEQLARVFSFVYREVRDNIFEFNSEKNLLVGDRKLQNGAKLTYLGETIEEHINGKITDSILVEYEDTNGIIPRVLMPTKYVRNIGKSKYENDLIRVNLKNKNSRLNVRSEGNLSKKILQFKDGMTVKNLGKKKRFNGYIYTLVEFYNKNGKVSRGYISESHTTKVKEKSSNTLDLYIRSLGLNPTNDFKKDLYRKVDLLKEFRGHLDQSKNVKIERIDRDNIEVYNMLIINFELRKLVEIEEEKLLNKNKQSSLKLELKDIPLKRRKKGLKQKPRNLKKESFQKKESREEKSENLNERLLKKIMNNKKFVEYLERKYKRKSVEANLSSLKRSIGYRGDTFRSNIMTFTYLFQKTGNLRLGKYYESKNGKKWGKLTSREKLRLFNKYAGEVNEIYLDKKESNNMTIFRGLIIENELGNDFITGIKKEKTRDHNFKNTTKDQYKKKLELRKKAKDYPVLSSKLGDWIVKRGPYRSGSDSCGRAVRKLLMRFGMPYMNGNGYEWENVLDKKTNEGYFKKVKINHPNNALPGGIIVYGKNARIGTSSRKRYGHVEIKGADKRYYSYYASITPGGSAKSGRKGIGYTRDTAFIGYVYYPVRTKRS